MHAAPLQPAYVLRGHAAAIHAVSFVRNNTRLLVGDADGWVTMWDVATRRPAAVWQAHTATILGVGSSTQDRIITHGRDRKLIVWHITADDEHRLSHALPVDGQVVQRPAPWMLSSLNVNTLNFCSFAQWLDTPTELHPEGKLLLAVPGAVDNTIVIYSLPDETIVSRISTDRREKTGMLMSLSIARKSDHLVLVAGFEIGSTVVWQEQGHASGTWTEVYRSQQHSQPVLSVAIAPDLHAFYSSGADSTVTKHHLDGSDAQTLQTMHSGQQGLTIRSDSRIFATAGWDGRARVYSTKNLQELAVLKWHKEGCYAVSFAVTPPEGSRDRPVGDTSVETASTALSRKSIALTVAQRREARAHGTHWLVLGSKDGKVSLWDVF